MAGEPHFMDYEARKHMSKEEIAALFDDVAQTYEQDVLDKEYRGFKDLVDAVLDLYPKNRSEVKIMDVAAGTGLVGAELHTHGFTELHWLDPSTGMKEETMKKKVYTTFFVEYMGGNSTSFIPTDTYDCLTCAGGFNEGLMPCSSLLEMIRLVKPGGHVVISLNQKVLTGVKEYKDRLLPEVNRLEDAGKWEKVLSNDIHHYITKHDTGLLLCYKVNVSEPFEK